MKDFFIVTGYAGFYGCLFIVCKVLWDQIIGKER